MLGHRYFAVPTSCARLPVVGGTAADGFQKMLRVQWRGTIRHLPTQIDRPSDSHRIALPVALSKRALGQKHQGPEITILFESALPEH